MISFEFNADLSGFERRIDEIEDAIVSSTRSAAHAGAFVLYSEMRQQVAQKPESVTGNLLESLYRQFAEDESAPPNPNAPQYEVATYVISWNHKKAGHGWLVENGHILWYQVRKVSWGWVTLKRPGVTGPKPDKHATRAEKDRYYMPWRDGGGPRWVEPYPFVRPTWEAKANAALSAARNMFFRRVREKLE